MSGFNTDSEHYFRCAWWLGWGLLLLVMLMMFILTMLRFQLMQEKRREQRFLAVWQPLLVASIEQIPTDFPPLHPRDWVSFLKLWNFLHESLKAQAKTHLNIVAKRIGMNLIARQLLRRGKRREQLLALLTLGQLRDATRWDELLAAAQSPDALLSLTAAKVLLRIDPPRALPLLVSLIASRTDWPTAALAAALKEAGAEIISEPLANAIRAVEPGPRPRLIRFLALAHASTCIAVVREVLRSPQELEVMTACLSVFRDAEGLATMRECLLDERWQVRMHAVVLLGRMGLEADVPLLIERLDDPEWWVRYHAAQALANLPFVTTPRLAQIAQTAPSDFARDMLKQVRAERELRERYT